MRLCPFCSAENADEMAACQSCGRRLPPLPPRRAGSKGPPTGISVPPRPTSATTPPPIPRPKGSTLPPPNPPEPEPTRVDFDASATRVDQFDSSATRVDPDPSLLTDISSPRVEPDVTLPRTNAVPTPAVMRDSAPALPPPPAVDDAWGSSAPPPTTPSNPRTTRPGTGAPLPRPNSSGPLPRANSSGVGRPAAAQNLLDALSPGPAAERRPAPPPESRIVGERRGANPPPAHTPPALDARSKSPSVPPPIGDRAKTPSGAPLPTTTPLAPAATTTNSGLGVVSAGGRAAFGDQTPLPPRATSPTRPPTLPPPRPGSSGISPAPIIASTRPAGGTEPPPTKIHRSEALVDRPFTPPKVAPVPEIPEPSLIASSKYAYQFAVARWQRRGAIRQLGVEIKQDTEALDQVLGGLGRAARGARVEGRVFSAENSAITLAEERIAQLQRDSAEVEQRKAEENTKFVDVERERNEKLVDAERMVEEAQKELQHLEAQRRSLRDKRKELERRQKAYLKNADDADRQAGAAQLGDQRQELRRSAEMHRKEAANLEPDKQEIDRRLASLERPISEASARLDAAKAELDATKRSLNDAREGHTHRLAELDAEQKRKAREVALAEAEIQRRLVTLGTLVNLNRIEDPQFGELYQRIDRLRGAITARTTEIEKLTAEREAYDRGTLVRGVATIGGVLVLMIALVVILRAIL